MGDRAEGVGPEFSPTRRSSDLVCAIFFKGSREFLPARTVSKKLPPHGLSRWPGRVAQLAEHSALNRQVVGSIPTASTRFPIQAIRPLLIPTCDGQPASSAAGRPQGDRKSVV